MLAWLTGISLIKLGDGTEIGRKQNDSVSTSWLYFMNEYRICNKITLLETLETTWTCVFYMYVYIMVKNALNMYIYTLYDLKN